MNNRRDIYRNPAMLKKSSKGSSKVTGKSVNDTEDNYGGETEDNYEEINLKRGDGLKREDISEVYINNEYDTSTMASLYNSDEDEDDDEEEEEEEEVKEKMVFSSSAGERMLIS